MKNITRIVWMVLLCSNSLGAMDADERKSQHAEKIRQEVQFLALKAQIHKQFFRGDKEKTERTFHALLAVPASDCKPSTQEVDQELVHALVSGNITATRQLLDRGANANGYAPGGATMLLVALAEDHLKVKHQLVKELLEHGADPNLASTSYWTPLHVAVQQLQLGLYDAPQGTSLMDTIKLLIQKGARLKLSLLDLKDQDSVRSPLSYIEPHCAQNSELITLLMTTVHSDDRLLGTYEEEIAFEVLARNKLLISMAPLSLSLQDTASGDACTRLRNMLAIEQHDAQYSAQVQRNVKTMMAETKK